MADDNFDYDDYFHGYDDDNANEVAKEVVKVCKVYDSEDFFTVFVQILLAFFALMSLWFKRQKEQPRRKFRTWFLDVSKQGVGACYAHVLNMIIAAIIVNNDNGVSNTSLKDQCAWYGMTYLVDTTLGLLLAIWGLKAIDWMANEWDWVSLKHTGVYEGVDGLLHWIHQALAWLMILTVGKVIIYYFMLWTADFLSFFGSLLFTPLQANIRFELLFVMIFFPGVLNVIYFWIADHYLKAGAEHAGAHEEETLDTELAQKKASLLPDDENGDAEVPKIWVTEDAPKSTGQDNAVV
mmetsp:Transcript_24051/g.56754  ORF Transcript_24051/g.56754 Transcript_24051/m.56754 type:complete len:294 (+) Transcript_24051:175-1056(+)|eukprot:CAMPEP_0197184160 /NCGR_PEP_ID=MMETSP1423-20130617/9326_1 /TAXON_ID=476441 /ORGANISM="Pseudo-nitzschia heimii, Strain UNC1101" /LENGTH=293 /DNA_ID=CAMNT_0042634907 /DNA_START=108 /DNA_END=989 /DNA_ORIENTATION=+